MLRSGHEVPSINGTGIPQVRFILRDLYGWIFRADQFDRAVLGAIVDNYDLRATTKNRVETSLNVRDTVMSYDNDRRRVFVVGA